MAQYVFSDEGTHVKMVCDTTQPKTQIFPKNSVILYPFDETIRGSSRLHIVWQGKETLEIKFTDIYDGVGGSNYADMDALVTALSAMFYSSSSGSSTSNPMTQIYVSNQLGSDTANNGSQSAPFKTIAKAMQVADANISDVSNVDNEPWGVVVLGGTYLNQQIDQSILANGNAIDVTLESGVLISLTTLAAPAVKGGTGNEWSLVFMEGAKIEISVAGSSFIDCNTDTINVFNPFMSASSLVNTAKISAIATSNAITRLKIFGGYIDDLGGGSLETLYQEDCVVKLQSLHMRRGGVGATGPNIKVVDSASGTKTKLKMYNCTLKGTVIGTYTLQGTGTPAHYLQNCIGSKAETGFTAKGQALTVISTMEV